MSCRNCSLTHQQHDRSRGVYIPGRGWIEPCNSYQAADAQRGVVVPGKSAARTMLKETFKFAEKKRIPDER